MRDFLLRREKRRKCENEKKDWGEIDKDKVEIKI
jgi:hypothetical protein